MRSPPSILESPFLSLVGKSDIEPEIATSLATIFGALPIAMALGAGAQSRVPLGIVVVGGLLFALILTLFVIPVMYTLMASNKEKMADKIVIPKSQTPLN